MVLEFAAVGDRLTGDALLADHAAPIGLLREALAGLGSSYVYVLDAVLATLPEITRHRREDGVPLASSGPPVEAAGLEPFGSDRSSFSWEPPMSTADILLWVVLPYVTVAVFVVGTVWRYRYDKFGGRPAPASCTSAS